MSWLHRECERQAGLDGEAFRMLLAQKLELESALAATKLELEHAKLLNLKMLDQLGNQKPQPQVQPVEPKEKKKPKISLRNAMSRAEQVDD